MKSFKEWLLSEMVYVFLPKPEKLTVIDGNRPKTVVIDAIDMRFEDWGLEPPQKQKIQPIVSKPPWTGSFSAPLADGSYLNATHSGFATHANIDPEPLFPVIRKDWAKFATLLNGNNVIKQPEYSRASEFERPAAG